jgi:hypothetical protein
VSAGRPRKLAPDDPRLGSGAQPAPVQLSDDAVWTRLSAGADLQVAKTATDVELHESVLTGVDLSGRDLRRLIARDVRFGHCDLSDDMQLTKAALLHCDLREASFRACQLRDVDLHGSQIDDLRDISGLAGVAVGADQVVPLALALLNTFGISVTDQPRMGGVE